MPEELVAHITAGVAVGKGNPKGTFLLY